MISDEEKPICSLCENEVESNDDFCPNCGTLFTEFVKCVEHTNKEAKGVCVICAEPYCEECGIFIEDRIFLCSEHSEYEAMEGMASVLNSDDSAQIELIKSDLEKDGLHPFIFSRKASSIHESPAYNGPINDRFQLMVPFQEVIRAEEILSDLKLLD